MNDQRVETPRRHPISLTVTATLAVLAGSVVAAPPGPPPAEAPGTLAWLALEDGRPVDCPVAIADTALPARTSCATTALEPRSFRKHVRSLLDRAERRGHVRADGWRRLEGEAIARRMLVHSAYVDVLFDPATGLVALTPIGCLPDGVVRADEVDRPPRVATRVRPAYPEAARVERAAGFAVVEGVVEPDGRIGAACVVVERPAGLGFGDSALRALQATRYEPARHGPRAVPVGIAMSHTFSIR